MQSPQKARRRFGLVLLIVGLLVPMAATACNAEQQAAFFAVMQHRQQIRLHPFLVCVRAHESDQAGGYQAQNRYSSASGAYQFLDSTWRNVSASAGHPGYTRAKYAPDWVQDEVAMWTYRNVGKSPWYGTGC